MILVIGATGKVGHYVVNGLLERGAPVRALTRNPDAARLPVGVEIVPGDLTDPKTFADHVSGVEAVFLLWPFLTAEAAAEVVDTLAGDAGRIVYLSAEAAGRRLIPCGHPSSARWSARQASGRSCDQRGSPPIR